MRIRRKKNKQAKRARREQQKRERSATRGGTHAPMIDILVGHWGPQYELFDDCPICRELRASGEPVYTIGTDGELVLISGADPGDASFH